jgi:uncharacterized protein YdhG (YjbR/CyaY superfamily)
MPGKPSTVDEYVGSFEEPARAVLQSVRTLIRAVIPDGVETISYGIPTITLDGRYVVYFAGWRHHVSLYPIPDGDQALATELHPYRSGKGTLRFPLDQPIPADLIRRVVARLVERRRG